jgi:hypothetical protein
VEVPSRIIPRAWVSSWAYSRSKSVSPSPRGVVVLTVFDMYRSIVYWNSYAVCKEYVRLRRPLPPHRSQREKSSGWSQEQRLVLTSCINSQGEGGGSAMLDPSAG